MVDFKTLQKLRQIRLLQRIGDRSNWLRGFRDLAMLDVLAEKMKSKMVEFTPQVTLKIELILIWIFATWAGWRHWQTQHGAGPQWKSSQSPCFACSAISKSWNVVIAGCTCVMNPVRAGTAWEFMGHVTCLCNENKHAIRGCGQCKSNQEWFQINCCKICQGRGTFRLILSTCHWFSWWPAGEIWWGVAFQCSVSWSGWRRDFTVTFCRSPLHWMPPPFPKCQIGCFEFFKFSISNDSLSLVQIAQAASASGAHVAVQTARCCPNCIGEAQLLNFARVAARNHTHFGSGYPRTVCTFFQSSWVLSGFCCDADQVLYSLIFETRLEPLGTSHLQFGDRNRVLNDSICRAALDTTTQYGPQDERLFKCRRRLDTLTK